jgi:transposase
MRELYVGLDLHSSNVYVGIFNKLTGRRIEDKRLRNDLKCIILALEPYREEIRGIVVESTYNWYWLVDGLMEAGYTCVHLANPSAIKQYEGLKHKDDRHDAFWLAHMFSLGILPEGYIYPKEERAVRDLLRKRTFLVRQRTSHILSFQTMVERQTGKRISSNEIKKLEPDDVNTLFADEYVMLSGKASICSIEHLTHQIRGIEKAIKDVIKLRPQFEYLLSVPGIGNILASTIMLEVGDVWRFAHVSNFSSYCRCAPSAYTSNGKKKGKGNTKNGNKYLSWAFIEAAHFARSHSPRINAYYQRKASQTNVIVAAKALSNKLARACYYIMRDQVPFREDALFS